MKHPKNVRRDYKLFLDDFRQPEDIHGTDGPNWTLVTSYDEFVETITERGLPRAISFDHDLSHEHYDPIHWRDGVPIDYNTYEEKTGYDCAKWLIENEYDLRPVFITVHSANPVGADNIRGLITSWIKHLSE